MYILKTETTFDSAHFLSGYAGKCANVHGHTWRIVAEIYSEKLNTNGQCRDMVVDFGDFKRELKNLAKKYDHTLIYEKDTLKPETISALSDENFSITEVDFRPTAEKFAEHFYNQLTSTGLNVKRISVYETPNNCAVYEV